ncbi:MAG TPA: NADH-ubiquinone oxidoreductase-F iron-sulfur binding region domain-containing protein [Acidimicrobiales bacterium]|nr:NADH-ubiquinone oxidoreductase-F iron-sulfur binding region domain-containing protein [Acidimicrobiales bacterium]
MGGPSGLPRLLRGVGDSPADVDAHVRTWGEQPFRNSRQELDLIDEAGLCGRGGAWFPTARKWRAVAANRGVRRPTVVANAAEGEPASGKDRLLAGFAPHLVLDGAQLAAHAVGAGRVVVYVHREAAAAVAAAVVEREGRGLDRVRPEVVVAAPSFVAGEESAVVAHIDGGPGGLPYFTVPRPVYRKGVSGRPTLVQNAETLAHAALISRFGPGWFREMGTESSPGTALLTISGVIPSRVVEAPVGVSLRSVLHAVSADADAVGGVLLGGYGGTWWQGAASDLRLAEEALRPGGATLGAGVVLALPAGACPVAETARIAAYMETQGAGQCGPCVNGLPALADAAAALAWDPRRLQGGPGRLEQLAGLVEGRGACHHPDGVARLIRSLLLAFPDHVRGHVSRGPCTTSSAPSVLPPLSAAAPAGAGG